MTRAMQCRSGRTLIGGILALIAGVTVLWLAGAIHQVEASASSPSLQTLVDQAAPGDRLTIPEGTYEGPLVIAKPLALIADLEGTVVLTYTGEGQALRVEADGVTVDGLRIIDETVKDEPTVLVTGDRVQLSNLAIITAADGIQLRGADGGELRGNQVEWSSHVAAKAVRLAAKGNGIDLYESHGNLVTGNRIRDMHDGIYLENSDHNEVTDNDLADSRYGVHCMYTVGTRILGNRGEGNVTGAMVMNTREVEITGNTFAKQNENVNSQGLLLFDAHATLVRDNQLEGNRVGVYVEQSSDNRLEDNRILDNFIGIQLLSASGNTLTGNEWLGNMADAQARGSVDNAISGNYWDAHRGIDVDGDGYSDISYAVNPLFSGIVQRRPQLQLLFQSPGMMFLEELYQADRQSWTTDVSPLMRPLSMRETEAGRQSGWLVGVAGLVLLAGTGILYYLARRRET